MMAMCGGWMAGTLIALNAPPPLPGPFSVLLLLSADGGRHSQLSSFWL